ncbi:hypothetical protein WJX72_003883 [[Myrmecia] bisecta]|uniref:DUF4385 domain-containing protein n=1 Tax=[Myrmecia] bisecta TaxID=41462 RepID=A0AAW1Q3R2_9CHLO
MPKRSQQEGVEASSHRPSKRAPYTSTTFTYPPQDSPPVDCRQQPQLYQVGRGEQGVLTVEPYKSEILPHWRFKTPDVARESSDKIWHLFLAYKTQSDFPGMDMSRKFLQMGYTRSMRYAKHKGGKKYNADGSTIAEVLDPVKLESAQVFKEVWKRAEADEVYQQLKAAHVKQYGRKTAP